MIIKCERCGEDIPIKGKKYRGHIGSSDKIHKMINCPNCGTKNFYPILKRYER